jgi:hypothetical protein
MKTLYKVNKKCPCGKKFVLTAGQVREKHGKYCSRPCYYTYRVNYDVSKLSHSLSGVKHWNYKENAGYKALHIRVSKLRGKADMCENNSNHKAWFEWANLTGNYNDINDYKKLCRSCHKNYDFSRKGGDVLA